MTFFNLEQLNEAISSCLQTWMNRNMNQRGTSRAELFNSVEQQTLLPLPATRFQIRKYRELTVAQNSHIELREDRHYYSVPYTWVGRTVQVCYTYDHVHIYAYHQLVAVHTRDRRANRYSTQIDHLPCTHQHWLKRSPHYYQQWAQRTGPCVAVFVERLFERVRHPEHGYRRCDGLMALHRKTDTQAFLAAIDLALRMDIYALSFVRNALRSGMATAHDAQTTPSLSDLPVHHNVRGRSYNR